MKKTLAFVMALALLCSLLAGCGSERTDNGVTVPSGSPIIDPSMAPEAEDGIVDDRDGFIEDEDGRTGGTAGKTAGDTAGGRTGDDAGIIDGAGTASGSTASAAASPSPSAGTQR